MGLVNLKMSAHWYWEDSLETVGSFKYVDAEVNRNVRETELWQRRVVYVQAEKAIFALSLFFSILQIRKCLFAICLYSSSNVNSCYIVLMLNLRI